MNGLYNWILNGRGRGKRYLLLLAVIFAAFSSFLVYFSWNAVLNTPNTQQIIRQLPDLKLQDGVLVKPENDYQDIIWSDTDTQQPRAYHFIIDTQNDEIIPGNAPQQGIYLTRKNIYVLGDDKVTMQGLKSIPNFEIKQGQLLPVLEMGNARFSWVLFFTLSIVLFILFYIWSLIYAVISYILTMFIPAENYTFAQRRRLSVAALICAYVLVLPFSFWGLYVGALAFIVMVLVFMSIFLAGLPKIFIKPLDK